MSTIKETKEWKAAERARQRENELHEEIQTCQNGLASVKYELEQLQNKRSEIEQGLFEGKTFANDLREIDGKIDEVKNGKLLEFSDRLQKANEELKEAKQKREGTLGRALKQKLYELVSPDIERLQEIDNEREKIVSAMQAELADISIPLYKMRAVDFPHDRNDNGVIRKFKLEKTLTEKDIEFIQSLNKGGK